MGEPKRIFYTLTDCAEQVGKTENELLQWAYNDALACSFNRVGMVIDTDCAGRKGENGENYLAIGLPAEWCDYDEQFYRLDGLVLLDLALGKTPKISVVKNPYVVGDWFFLVARNYSAGGRCFVEEINLSKSQVVVMADDWERFKTEHAEFFSTGGLEAQHPAGTKSNSTMDGTAPEMLQRLRTKGLNDKAIAMEIKKAHPSLSHAELGKLFAAPDTYVTHGAHQKRGKRLLGKAK